MALELKHIPLADPRPDAGGFIDILMGRARDRVPLVEYLVDEVVMRPIVTGLLGRPWAMGSDRDAQRAHLDNYIAFWQCLGYDFVRFERGLGFEIRHVVTADTASGSEKERAWVDEHHGVIQSWEDLDRYPWPNVENYDFSAFDYIAAHLPEGMGLMTCHGGGIFEHVSQMMSLEGLSLALYDDPALVEAVTEQVGQRMLSFYRHLLDLEGVIAIFPGDDMGFRTATLVAPSVLAKTFLPWHQRFAAMAHDKGLPYLLHSCGNVEAIMDPLIEEVGIDGKHSFEDAILPAEAFHVRYGERIAVLGGVDVHILAAGTPQMVRDRTRSLIEICGARGRYAVGSGNSIPSYIPVENYLAMVDEALDSGGRSGRSGA